MTMTTSALPCVTTITTSTTSIVIGYFEMARGSGYMVPVTTPEMIVGGCSGRRELPEAPIGGAAMTLV